MTAPKVYDWSQKQWVLLPDHDVTDAVASGSHSFASGIDIPVVSPDGTLGTVPSDKVQEAFQNGYRWQTGDDIRAFESAQNQAIMEQNYGEGHGAQAFIEGAVKGGIPGAVPLQKAIAPLMGGSADDIEQGVSQLEEKHPVLNLAGELTGATASPITEAFGGGARTLGENLAKDALKDASSQIVKTLGRKGVGSALEGAYYGLHDGLNESSLGDPSDIAESLMAHMGEGLIFGGVAGTALEGASLSKTAIKDIFSAGIDKLSAMSERAAQKAAKGAILPTLDKDLRAIASPLIDDAVTRQQYFFEGGEAAVKKTAEEMDAVARDLRKFGKSTLDDLRRGVKGYPKQIQAEIDEALNGASGDLFHASKNKYVEWEGERLALESRMAQDSSPGSIFSQVDEETEKVIKRLEKYGDKQAVRKAKEIETFIEAQRTAHQLPHVVQTDTTPYEMLVRAGKEMQLTSELRDRIREGLEDLPGGARAIAKEYADNLTYLMYEHPQFGADLKKLDAKYDAFSTIRGFISKNGEDIDKKIVSRLKHDPEFARHFDALMSRFPDAAPHIQEFKAKLADPLQAQIHLTEIRNMMRDAGVRGLGRIGKDDLLQIADAIGPSHIADKAQKLREIDAILEHGDQGPISKYVQYLRALGRPVPEGITAFEHNQKALMDLYRVAGPGQDQSLAEQLLKKGSQGILKAGALKVGSMLAGATLGHTFMHGPVGIITGAVAGGLAKRALNPAHSFETLTKLERAINESYSKLDRATQAAIDGLTSKAARNVTVKAGGFTRDLDKKKSSFQERSAYLEKMANPDFLAHEAENRIGTTDAAPKINAAVIAQYTKSVQFLTSKLPVDPLAHQSIDYQNTGWRPSDMELAKFERYAASAENPTVALANIAKGRVSPEEIETLKVLYPQTFQRLQEGVLDAIMEPSKHLSYTQKVLIGSLFDVTTDVSMRPSFILACQARFNNKPADGPHPTPLSSNPKVPPQAEAMQTEAERITYKT